MAVEVCDPADRAGGGMRAATGKCRPLRKCHQTSVLGWCVERGGFGVGVGG